MKPLSRQDELIIRELPGEVLIYDLTRHKAICLNHTAALVLQHCDGRRTVPQLSELLEMDVRLVWYAVKLLNRENLLSERARLPSFASGLTRRELVKTLGIAVAVPVIASIVAPTAQAQVSIPCIGAFCNANNPCQAPCFCSAGRCAVIF